jgi:hypothetical protein
MKASYLLVFMVGVLAYITLSSRSGGVGAQNNSEAAGAPGGGTCAACHSGGTFSPTTTIDIRNSAGTTVTTVEGDSVYDVTVTITAGSGTPAGYGFQAIFLSDSANANAGTFQNPGTGQATHTFANGRVAIEHNTPATGNTFSFQWKAPAYAPGGTATLYAYGLAVNRNFGTSGDVGDAVTYQVTVTSAAQNPTALNRLDANMEISIFPNPAVSYLNVNFDITSLEDIEFGVFNANGQLVKVQNIAASEASNQIRFDISDLAAGAYLLVATNTKGARISKSFVKF